MTMLKGLANNGHTWKLEVWVSQRGRPTIVVPLPPKNADGGGNPPTDEPQTNSEDAEPRFSPSASQEDGENVQLAFPHAGTTSVPPIYADEVPRGRRKSTRRTRQQDTAMHDC